MRMYASDADLAVWIGGVNPPNPGNSTMRRASLLIDAALVASVYPTNAGGWPTCETQIEALRDATCALVEYWLTTGDDGRSERTTSAEIGGVKFTKTFQDQGTGGRRLPIEVRTLLREAGLLSQSGYRTGGRRV